MGVKGQHQDLEEVHEEDVAEEEEDGSGQKPLHRVAEMPPRQILQILQIPLLPHHPQPPQQAQQLLLHPKVRELPEADETDEVTEAVLAVKEIREEAYFQWVQDASLVDV